VYAKQNCRSLSTSNDPRTSAAIVINRMFRNYKHNITQHLAIITTTTRDYYYRVLGMCGKPKFSSDSDIENPNHPKIWHPCRWLSDRTCVQSAVQIKSDKNNFPCIQSADKECFKTWPKQSLAYRCSTQLHYLLVVVVVSVKVWYAQFIQHSTVTL